MFFHNLDVLTLDRNMHTWRENTFSISDYLFDVYGVVCSFCFVLPEVLTLLKDAHCVRSTLK